MAQVALNVRDDFKDRLQAYCSGRSVSITQFMVAAATKEMEGDSLSSLGMDIPGPCKCLLCGFGWIPRRSNPSACPNCKSYRWNDVDEASRKRKRLDERQKRIDEYEASRDEMEHRRQVRAKLRIERNARREQTQLYKDFMIEIDRITRLTKSRIIDEVAARIGTTPEKLLQYIRKEKPVTAEQVNALRLVK